MRLIDADELTKVMTQDWFLDILLTQNGKSDIAKRLADMIDSVPLAYDVENVLAELEYQKEQCEKDMKYYEEKSWKDHISHTNYDLFFAQSDCWEDAIDIVKTGGV